MANRKARENRQDLQEETSVWFLWKVSYVNDILLGHTGERMFSKAHTWKNVSLKQTQKETHQKTASGVLETSGCFRLEPIGRMMSADANSRGVC